MEKGLANTHSKYTNTDDTDQGGFARIAEHGRQGLDGFARIISVVHRGFSAVLCATCR